MFAEIADRCGREHAVADLLPVDLADFHECIDQRRHHAGGPAGGSRDHEVAAPVLFRCRYRKCRQHADTAVCLKLVVHGALVDGGCLAVQLDRAGQHVVLRHRQPRLHRCRHRVDDLVDESIDLRFGPARDRHLVRQHDLGNRGLVLVRVGPQLLHRPERVLRRVLRRRRVAFPLDESAAHRVILLFEQHLGSGQEFGRHGVRVWEVAFGGVVDDVLQAHIKGGGAELHRERLVRVVAEVIEKRGIDGCRFFPNHSCQRGALCAVPFAGGAEAAVQVDFQRRRLREFVRRQLGAALVEIVGDAHWADRVRAGRARPHFVEFVQRRHHRPLCLLHDIQTGIQLRRHSRGDQRRPRGPLCSLLGGDIVPGNQRCRADHGASHQESPAIHAMWNLLRNQPVRAAKQIFLVGFL